MKKLLAMLVVALGVGSLFAVQYTDEEGRTWLLSEYSSAQSVSGESIKRWKINGCYPLPEGDFTVPAKLGNMTVHGIAATAKNVSVFQNASNLTSVTISAGIKRIGQMAFGNCPKLERVSLPAGLEYVHARAFAGSKIEAEKEESGWVQDGYLIKYTGTSETYTIPDGVKMIAAYAFDDVSDKADKQKQIKFEGSPEEILEFAFQSSNFGDVTLPDSLTSIAAKAFTNCTFKSLKLGKGITDLKKVGVNPLKPADDNGVSFFEAFNNAKFESIDFGDGVEAIPAGLFATNATLKSVKFGSALRVIGGNAFSGSAVTNFDFSAAAKLEKIGQLAFASNKVVKVDLSACTKLTEIPTRCFFGCNALREVTFNEGLQTIGSQAFDSYDAYRSSEGLGVLGSLTFPKSLKTIEDRAFYGSTNLSEVVLNDGLEKIGSEAFGTEVYYDGPWGEFIANSRLAKVDIPASVTTLGVNVFNACSNLWEITGGAGVDQFSGAFGDLVPAFASVEKDASGNELPFKVLTFGKAALGFQGKCPSELTAAQFGDITAIGASAFAGWSDNMSISNLVKVVVPETIRAIGPSAFAANENLKTLDLSAASPELAIGSQAFYMTGIEELKGVVSMIDGGAFEDCKNLKEVDVAVEPIVETDEDDPEWSSYSRAFVETAAFAGCSKLTNATVTVAASVPAELLDVRLAGAFYIGADTFRGCTTLKEVNVAAPLIIAPSPIAPSLFSNCPAIEKVTVNAKEIPEDFLNVGRLNGPTNLTELALGNMVKTISRNAFEGNKNISAVELPEGLEDIYPDVFNGCSNLVTVTGGEALTRVGPYAFLGTKFFNEAPAGALKLGSMLVKWTGDDETVTIPDGITNIASSAFLGCKAVKVIVPESVGIIREGTFEKCPNLSQVEFKNREIQLVYNSNRSKDESPITFWYDDCPLLAAAGDKALIVPNKGAFIFAGWKKNPYGDGYQYLYPDYQKLAFHNDASADGAFVPGSSYTGWIMNGQSDENNYVVGTVTVKTGKLDKNNEVKVTMTVQLAGVKKNYTAMFKIDENGKAVISDASAKQLNDLAGMYLGGTWLSGQVKLAGRHYAYTVRGANSGKEALAGMDGFAGKVWGMYLKSSTSELAPVVNGYSGLSISVAKKGKVKVSGTLADGQKVSATAQMAAGDNGVFAAPFYIQTNGKKGGFGFVIDFYMDGDSPRAWFEAKDDGVGKYMTMWQYPLEFGVTDGPNASSFVQITLSSKKGELFEIDPKGAGFAEGAYKISGSFDTYAQKALNVACKSPVVEASPSAELTVDAKGKWTFAKATKVSLATEKDLEKYQGDIDDWLAFYGSLTKPSFECATSDGKVLDAYDFDHDEILGTYTPTAYFLCDVGSKVKGGELVVGENTNFYALKLSYAKKTGLVSGSSVYYWVDVSNADKPKLKKGKTTVSGIVLDGTIYGTSTVKGVASCKLNSREAK